MNVMHVLLIFTVLTNSIVAQASNEVLLSPLREIELPHYQRQTLAEDAPFSSMILDDSNGVWLLGKKHMWRWGLLDGQLQKYQLHQEKDKITGYRNLITDGVSLYFTSDTELFCMQLNPVKMVRLPIPNADARTLSIGLTEHEIFWTTTAGTYQVSRNLDRVSMVLKTPFVAQDATLYDDQLKIQWIARNEAILMTGQRRDKVRSRLAHKTNTSILGLDKVDDEIFAYTEKVILRFSNSGDLLQAIPVLNDRKLQIAELKAGMHSYLFTDGLFERYSISTKQTRHYQMPLSQSETTTSLLSRKNVAAVIVEGQPRAFHLLDVD